MGSTFSTSQVAQLLGLSNATVKRLYLIGQLPGTISAGAREHAVDAQAVLNYLRRAPAEPLPSNRSGTRAFSKASAIEAFVEALSEGLSACVAELIVLFIDGLPLARAFDEVVVPALARNAGAHLDFIERAQPLAEPGKRRRRSAAQSAVVAAAGTGGLDAKARMIGCLLRAHGFSVLSPRDNASHEEVAGIVMRSHAAVAAFTASAVADQGQVSEYLSAALQAVDHTGGRVIFGSSTAATSAALPKAVHRVDSLASLVSEIAR